MTLEGEMKEKKLVPDFQVREDLEQAVKAIAELQSKLMGLTLDGTEEERMETRTERDALITSTGAEELSDYLAPYTKIALEEGGVGNVYGEEWARWFAEYAVRNFLGKVKKKQSS